MYPFNPFQFNYRNYLKYRNRKIIYLIGRYLFLTRFSNDLLDGMIGYCPVGIMYGKICMTCGGRGLLFSNGGSMDLKFTKSNSWIGFQMNIYM